MTDEGGQPERTPEERAAAAAERAARRAARADRGASAPDAAPPDLPAPARPELAAADLRATRGGAAAPDAATPGGPTAASAAVGSGGAAPTADGREVARGGAAPTADGREPARADAAGPPAATRMPADDDSWDWSAGPDAEWGDGDGQHGAMRPSAPPRRVRPAGRKPAPGRARGRARWWLRRFGAVLALALIGAALWAINAVFQPFHGDGTGPTVVRIPDGASAAAIGRRLQAAGVVESARAFELNATLTLRRGELKPGRYTLARGMSNGDAIEALMAGPAVRVIPTFRLTIPEGRSIREVAPLARRAELDGDYVRATTSARLIARARGLGLPRAQRSLEGFLFPATYVLQSGAPATDLVERQLTAFRRQTRRVSYRYARSKNLSRYDVLTIASMVEREAQLARERRLIAAVIYNRLRRGMPLGIDATIRYATRNWSRPIRRSELARDGPYNSRTRRGLPPTPIGNPGLASIRAAANPAKVPYLYFVVKPGSDGEHAFSSNEADFARDVERYEDARAAKGGRAP